MTHARKARYVRIALLVITGAALAWAIGYLFWSLRDPVVERREISRNEGQTTVACHYYGYCFRCGLGADGKHSCGYQLTAFCRGERPATGDEVLIEITRESGKQQQLTLWENLKEKGECQ